MVLLIFQLTSESRGLGGSGAGSGCSPCLAGGGTVAGGGIPSTLPSMLPSTSRRSGPGTHSWHPVTAEPPVKSEPGACKPPSAAGCRVQRACWLHPQSSVSWRSLRFPGDAKGRQRRWRGARWALLLLAPLLPPSEVSPVPGSPSEQDGSHPPLPLPGERHPGGCPWDSAAAFRPCCPRRRQGRGMCAGTRPGQSVRVVGGTSGRLRGEAGSFWGLGTSKAPANASPFAKELQVPRLSSWHRAVWQQRWG